MHPERLMSFLTIFHNLAFLQGGTLLKLISYAEQRWGDEEKGEIRPSDPDNTNTRIITEGGGKFSI